MLDGTSYKPDAFSVRGDLPCEQPLLFQTRIFRMARLRMVIREGLTLVEGQRTIFKGWGLYGLKTKSSHQWTHKRFVAKVAPPDSASRLTPALLKSLHTLAWLECDKLAFAGLSQRG